MTNREFFTAVLNAHISDEIDAFCTEARAKLDARNEHRRTTPTKAQKENEPIKEAIMNYLADHDGALASELAGALEQSTQKITALCTLLAKDGRISVTDCEVKGGTRKAYSIAE